VPQSLWPVEFPGSASARAGNAAGAVVSTRAKRRDSFDPFDGRVWEGLPRANIALQLGETDNVGGSPVPTDRCGGGRRENSAASGANAAKPKTTRLVLIYSPSHKSV
jgi:hypothetical protein